MNALHISFQSILTDVKHMNHLINANVCGKRKIMDMLGNHIVKCQSLYEQIDNDNTISKEERTEFFSYNSYNNFSLLTTVYLFYDALPPIFTEHIPMFIRPIEGCCNKKTQYLSKICFKTQLVYQSPENLYVCIHIRNAKSILNISIIQYVNRWVDSDDGVESECFTESVNGFADLLPLPEKLKTQYVIFKAIPNSKIYFTFYSKYCVLTDCSYAFVTNKKNLQNDKIMENLTIKYMEDLQHEKTQI